MKSETLFQLENVSRDFSIREGLFKKGQTFGALKNLTLTLKAGESYGLVGGSGSGKTTLARLLTGLMLPTHGRIFYREKLLSEAFRDRQVPYFHKVQMVFQNPYQSLDPKWSVRRILEEGLGHFKTTERSRRTEEALEKVCLERSYLDRKPAALSGGERQRVALARALAVKPDFLILDEPTSQLDVSVQAQILELLISLKPELPGGMLFITHDLALVSRLAEHLIVLSKGEIAEQGQCAEVLRAPRHETTRALLAAIPVWNKKGKGLHEEGGPK